MPEDLMWSVSERDGDGEVTVEVRRFECGQDAFVPGPPHGFSLEYTVLRPEDAYPQRYDLTLFYPSDVLKATLPVSPARREKWEGEILEACFGVVAWASYLFFNPGAELGFQILMTAARSGDGYTLTMGEQVSVPFKTLEDLQAMLPPFGAEGERGYEEARASLLAWFKKKAY